MRLGLLAGLGARPLPAYLFPVCLLAACLLAVCLLGASTAVAQDGHYHTLGLGQEAIGLGGAYTGVADEQGAGWYNPGGLAFVGDSLSGTLLLHSFEHIRFRGDGLELESIRRPTFPLFASGVKHVGPRDEEGRRRHAVGIVVVRPLQVRRGFEPEFRTAGARSTSLSVFRTTHETWFGPTWGSQVHPKVGIGATLMTTVSRFEHREAIYSLDSSADRLVVRDSLTEIRSNDIILRMGVLYRDGPFRLGLMVQPPGIPVRAEGIVEETRLTGGARDNEAVSLKRENVEANEPRPFRARLGTSYRFNPKFRVAADVQFVAPVKNRTRIAAPPPGEAGPGEPAVGAFVDLSTERRAVVNGAVGMEWIASDWLSLRFGAYTDFSSNPSVPETSSRYTEPRVPSFGGSGSFGIHVNQTHLHAGVGGVGGRGDALLIDSDSGVGSPSYSRGNARRRVVYFFVGGGFGGEESE